MSATTITFNGERLVVNADGRARKEYTPMGFYALSPDSDLHETAVRAIAQPGVPQPVLGRARELRPRYARTHGICQ